MMRLLIPMTVAALAWSSTPVHAQSAAARPRSARPQVVIELDGNFLTTTRTFTDSAAPLIHAETAEVTATYRVPTTVAFSAGAFVRVWKQLSAGFTYARSSRPTETAITASLPHPFFFSRHRRIEGIATDTQQQNSTVALQLRASYRTFNRTTVSVFGGPAWLSVRQGIVERVNYAETYPYDTATYTSPTVTNATRTRLTVLAGGDVTYFVSRMFGVGAGIKYGAATIELPSLDNDVLTIKAGGASLTTGVRVRF